VSGPPSLFRIELIHPMVVHAPLVLLLAGVPLRLLSFLVHERKRWAFLLPASQMALTIGAAGAWLAVVTGVLADGVVGHTLCDPTVAKTHEQHAELATVLFSLAILLDLSVTRLRWLEGGVLRRWLFAPVALALLVGSGFLIHTGHLGARLVYQQGAAVHRPSSNCAEFE